MKKEVDILNDEEFMQLMDGLEAYLAVPKTFVPNPKRIADVKAATEIAKQLFPEAKISVINDPLQIGASILHIEDYSISAVDTEIPLFSEMISKATNFDFYVKGNEIGVLSIVFNDAFVRVKI